MEFEPTPKWSFRLFHESTHSFHTPAAPCLFHRITQRLILGLVWERLEERDGLARRAWRWIRGR